MNLFNINTLYTIFGCIPVFLTDGNISTFLLSVQLTCLFFQGVFSISDARIISFFAFSLLFSCVLIKCGDILVPLSGFAIVSVINAFLYYVCKIPKNSWSNYV